MKRKKVAQCDKKKIYKKYYKIHCKEGRPHWKEIFSNRVSGKGLVHRISK